MKLKITYELDSNYTNIFWAKTKIGIHTPMGCSSESFEDAKKRLLEDVSGLIGKLKAPVPEPEEVEIGD